MTLSIEIKFNNSFGFSRCKEQHVTVEMETCLLTLQKKQGRSEGMKEGREGRRGREGKGREEKRKKEERGEKGKGKKKKKKTSYKSYWAHQQ